MFYKTLSQILALMTGYILLATAHAQECVYPESRSYLKDREAYVGYQPTGYKGSMERDETWFRFVTPVKQGDGTVRYGFKKQRASYKTLYDSIEPVFLGGNARGFAAYRNGCGTLLDFRSKELGLPSFSTIESDYIPEGQGANVVRLKLSGLASSGWRYALFQNGKLKALSPSDYVDNTFANAVDSRLYLPPGYRDVSSKMTDGWGVIKLETLDEVVSPRWQGVGGLIVYEDYAMKNTYSAYLVAKDEQRLHLYSSDGNPLRIPPFDDIRVVYDWFPRDFVKDRINRTVITTIDKNHNTCRVYSANMAPIIDDDIPFENATRQCPRPKGAFFSFTNKFGHTQIFDVKPAGRLLPRTEKTDVLVYQFRSGVMLLRKNAQDGNTFWVSGPDGARLHDMTFTDFTPLGCDFVRVKYDGTWVMLLPDGEIKKKLLVPHSC